MKRDDTKHTDEQLNFHTIYSFIGRRVYLLSLFIFGAIIIILIFLWRQQAQVSYNSFLVDRTQSWLESNVTAGGSGGSAAVPTTIETTPLTTIVDKVDQLTVNNYASYLDGQFVKWTDQPVAADIAGTFTNGLTVNPDSVALGTDTVGNYVQSITVGDGLGGGGLAEGASVSLSVQLHQDGGLEFNGGAVGLTSACADGQLLKWNDVAEVWVCGSDISGSGGAVLTVREADNAPSVAAVQVLEFGPASGSDNEFIVTNQGGGTARLRTGTAVPLTTANATITGNWTFDGVLTANGSLSCSSCIALGPETSGSYLAGVSVGTGIAVTGSGGAGATPTIGLDSSLAIFKTIDASSGTDPVADSLSDTLALTGGNGVAINGDAVTDAVTVSMNLSGGGGLQFSSGAVTMLNTCADGQLLKWNDTGDAWECSSDIIDNGVTLTVREADGAPSVPSAQALEFGPATGSDNEFVVTSQGGGTARVRTGTAVPLTNADVTISGSWTFNAALVANGGLSCSSCITLGSETNGNYLADLLAGTGIAVTGGGAEGATPTIGLDSSLAIFKTIDASSGTDPVADSLTDTLTLSSGNGILVAGNAGTDSVSFTADLAVGGGLSFSGGALSLLSSCASGEVLQWNSGSSSWGCAALAATPNNFGTVAADSGSAVADATGDTLSLFGGNGLITNGASTPDAITFDVDVASGSGLTFSGGALSLLACSNGEVLKRSAGAWACSSDNNAPSLAYQQQLAGTDNVIIGSSATPLLTNGSGAAQSLPITVLSGTKVLINVTVELSSTLATGPVNYTIIRDDNADNDCATGGGDGTQVGGQITSFIATIAQSFTNSFTFADASPGAPTVRYQVCAATPIAIGATTVTDRSVTLQQVSF